MTMPTSTPRPNLDAGTCFRANGGQILCGDCLCWVPTTCAAAAAVFVAVVSNRNVDNFENATNRPTVGCTEVQSSCVF